jgi:hypothetical protein
VSDRDSAPLDERLYAMRNAAAQLSTGNARGTARTMLEVSR